MSRASFRLRVALRLALRLALWLALASPELDVRLVTVCGGNVGLERTLANARAIVGLAGRAVPVVGGARRARGRESKQWAHS